MVRKTKVNISSNVKHAFKNGAREQRENTPGAFVRKRVRDGRNSLGGGGVEERWSEREKRSSLIIYPVC